MCPAGIKEEKTRSKLVQVPCPRGLLGTDQSRGRDYFCKVVMTNQPWAGYVAPITSLVQEKSPHAVSLVQRGCRQTVLVTGRSNYKWPQIRFQGEYTLRNTQAHRATAESRNQSVNISQIGIIAPNYKISLLCSKKYNIYLKNICKEQETLSPTPHDLADLKISQVELIEIKNTKTESKDSIEGNFLVS